MHPYHPFWSLEVPRVDGQLLLTPAGTQQVPLTWRSINCGWPVPTGWLP